MPNVSIIVPVYNVEKYLQECVDSLINQTMKDIEIILVDDGSPDHCPEMCDRFAAQDDRVRVIHKQNAGVSAARNDGLKIATGEYVIFCDSDDWMDAEACEILFTTAKEKYADVSIADVYMVYKKKENKEVNFYDKSFVTNQKEDIIDMIKADIFRSYCANPPAAGPAFGYGGPWNKLVKRSLLIENKIIFDVSVKGVFDDILYTAYVLANAKRVCYVQRPVYFYRQLEDSLTHNFNPNILEINNAIFKAWDNFMKKYDFEHCYEKPFWACVIRRIDETMKLYYANKNNPKQRKELVQELQGMLKTEPYKTAVKKVEVSKLSKRQKAIVILARFKLCNLLVDIY